LDKTNAIGFILKLVMPIKIVSDTIVIHFSKRQLSFLIHIITTIIKNRVYLSIAKAGFGYNYLKTMQIFIHIYKRPRCNLASNLLLMIMVGRNDCGYTIFIKNIKREARKWNLSIVNLNERSTLIDRLENGTRASNSGGRSKKHGDTQ